MRILRGIQDFLDVAAAHASSAAARRAIREGNYTQPVRCDFPWGTSGWRFSAMSPLGGKWAVSIEVLEDVRRYRVRTVKVK